MLSKLSEFANVTDMICIHTYIHTKCTCHMHDVCLLVIVRMYIRMVSIRWMKAIEASTGQAGSFRRCVAHACTWISAF